MDSNYQLIIFYFYFETFEFDLGSEKVLTDTTARSMTVLCAVTPIRLTAMFMIETSVALF